MPCFCVSQIINFEIDPQSEVADAAKESETFGDGYDLNKDGAVSVAEARCGNHSDRDGNGKIEREEVFAFVSCMSDIIDGLTLALNAFNAIRTGKPRQASHPRPSKGRDEPSHTTVTLEQPEIKAPPASILPTTNQAPQVIEIHFWLTSYIISKFIFGCLSTRRRRDSKRITARRRCMPSEEWWMA